MIIIHPDSIKVITTEVGFTLKMSIGEYEAEEVSQIVKIPKGEVMTVQIQELKDFEEEK